MSFSTSKARDGLRRLMPRKALSFLRSLVYPEKIYLLEERLEGLFKTYYGNLASKEQDQKEALKNAEFKIYSKHGNDGILLYIFSKIGVKTNSFIEIGIEDGRECNVSNLALNFGWNGLMIDANPEWVKSALAFYKQKLGEKAKNVKIIPSFVSRENVNDLFKNNHVTGEIDLFSLDIDGNDYWVWQVIDVIKPRVVVLEYNAALGDKSLTMKYNPEHHYQSNRKHPLYFGASLKALTKLSREKGYVLVGCDSNGHDAFFVRKDLIEGKFRELSPEEAFYPNPYNLKDLGSLDEQFDLIKDFDFETI